MKLSITNYRALTLGEELQCQRASRRCKRGTWLSYDLCTPEKERGSTDEKISLNFYFTLRHCLLYEDMM